MGTAVVAGGRRSGEPVPATNRPVASGWAATIGRARRRESAGVPAVRTSTRAFYGCDGAPAASRDVNRSRVAGHSDRKIE